MKKLFISCPMNGRTEENIKKTMSKMHRIAEAIFDEELEVIDTYNPDDYESDMMNSNIYGMGKAILKMAEADYFIGVRSIDFRGCNVERFIAEEYGLESTFVEPQRVMTDHEILTDRIKLMCSDME